MHEGWTKRAVAALALTASISLAGEAQNPIHGTPDEIEDYKEKLEERIRADRTSAKRGDVLNPELTSFLKARFRRIAKGEDGKEVLALIKESNPGDLPLRVNEPYPEEAPLATMPPLVLKSFPKLPEGIEYRFVGCRLMLLAGDSRMVIDYTEECFW